MIAFLDAWPFKQSTVNIVTSYRPNFRTIGTKMGDTVTGLDAASTQDEESMSLYHMEDWLKQNCIWDNMSSGKDA